MVMKCDKFPEPTLKKQEMTNTMIDRYQTIDTIPLTINYINNQRIINHYLTIKHYPPNNNHLSL